MSNNYPCKLIGVSKNIQEVKELVEIAAKIDRPVLITGETGTGKELVAKGIFYNDENKNGSEFVAINCAALQDTLLESELFGYVKGAFTGAEKTTPGIIEAANEGTLFLDEIGSMSHKCQGKILRVLQEGKYRQVGGITDLEANIRVVAASNTDMKQAIKEKKFREDLFYRLNVFPIHISPLRERTEDIPHLIKHFFKKYQEKYPVDEDFKEYLIAKNYLNQPLKGNVRELENIIERSMILENNSFKEDLNSTKENPFPILPSPETIIEFYSEDQVAKILQGTGFTKWRGRLFKLSKERYGTKETMNMGGISRSELYRRIKKSEKI